MTVGRAITDGTTQSLSYSVTAILLLSYVCIMSSVLSLYVVLTCIVCQSSLFCITLMISRLKVFESFVKNRKNFSYRSRWSWCMLRQLPAYCV